MLQSVNCYSLLTSSVIIINLLCDCLFFQGDELHWLVCALYSACRRNLPLMKSVSGKLLSSNCVSLTMLLREAKFRSVAMSF